MKLTLRKIKFLILFLVIVIILLLSLNQCGVKNFFYSISESKQKALWERGDSISDFWEGFFQSKNLKRENEELRRRNQELLDEIVSFRRLEEENMRLREALGIGLQEDFELVLADLISKDVAGDFVRINKGSEDSLAVDMPVITEEKILVGRIIEVYEDYSRVMLISNPESSFPAEIEEEVAGFVKGKGIYQISLERVPQDREIGEGAIVVTCSLGGAFPKGLLVGEIKKVQKSDTKPFQKVEVYPFFDIEELKTVFVITSF